jgi:PAS domain S-box-containing protein
MSFSGEVSRTPRIANAAFCLVAENSARAAAILRTVFAMPLKRLEASLRAVNHISAMVAYWDREEKCRFANNAYLEWFGRAPTEMEGITMKELLGPLYEKNLPYIRGVLGGRKQVFERQITLPSGEVRESIATYLPDLSSGIVCGFTAQVADVTHLHQREAALSLTIKEVIQVLEKTKQSFRSKDLGILRERLLQLGANRHGEETTVVKPPPQQKF